jgi:hypothetical protein
MNISISETKLTAIESNELLLPEIVINNKIIE